MKWLKIEEAKEADKEEGIVVKMDVAQDRRDLKRGEIEEAQEADKIVDDDVKMDVDEDRRDLRRAKI